MIRAAAFGSFVVLAAVAAYLFTFNPVRPLVVFAAPTCRLPLERIATDFERETGRKVELTVSPSEDLLWRVRFSQKLGAADLFIPADESYVRQAGELNLVTETRPIADVHAVLLLPASNRKSVTGWADLFRPGVVVGVPNSGAAIGKLVRQHLVDRNLWQSLEPNVIDCGSVSEAANAAKLGTVDAAIVWDAVAAGPGYRGQVVIRPEELWIVRGRIEVALLRQSSDPVAAKLLAEMIVDPSRGGLHFRNLGFQMTDTDKAGQ